MTEQKSVFSVTYGAYNGRITRICQKCYIFVSIINSCELTEDELVANIFLLLAAGQRMGANESLMLMIGAAKRDAAQFVEPDHFDITRCDNKHIAFGLGPHYCLGAPLARLETQIALHSLLARYPHMRLADEQVRWHKHPTFLGLESLAVMLT